MPTGPRNTPTTHSASLGFEDRLWGAADLLRSTMDPSEYKHVVLGLLFLKYLSDAAEAPDGVRVPATARWSAWVAQPDPLGPHIHAAMDAIEAADPRLAGALPRVYTRPGLDPESLRKLVGLFTDLGLGTADHRARDTLGRVYEYFLGRFASTEGKGGGEFYTPASVVQVLVRMLQPVGGTLYDPCCGSGGLFIQSLRVLEAEGGRRHDVTVYGQESNPTTWRLAKMNLAIRGIDANLGTTHADTLRYDQHPSLQADTVLANPPFNISAWHGETLRDDPRWAHGVPPVGNANFAWVQHMLHHLAPQGRAGIVLANGSLSSMSGGEGEIRARLVAADRVDCIVALPGQLFYSTTIPVCLWFLARSKTDPRLRDRRGEVLFIDGSALGRMQTRVHRVLDADDIDRITGAYRAWSHPDGGYTDEPGFCRAATLAEIQAHESILTPGRYVGVAPPPDDTEPLDATVRRLSATLQDQQAEGQRLDAAINALLRSLGA